MRLKKLRKAFSLVELVMAIVVMGILASLAIPRLERDLQQEAIDNIVSAFRYTQQLALMDDKTDPTDPEWQKKLWNIRFFTSSNIASNFYTICSDKNKNGAISKDECAVEPNSGKYYYNLAGDATIASDEASSIFIGKKYGIKNIIFDSNCQSNASTSSHHIAFDRYGRPHIGVFSGANDFRSYLKNDCIITFEFIDPAIKDFNITVAKQTGYVTVQR